MTERSSVRAMPVSGKAFVKAAMTALDVDTQADLVRVLRLGLAQSKVSRWFNGRNDPDYESVMAVLETCGWLTEDARLRLAQAETEEGERGLADVPRSVPKAASPKRRQATGGTQ